MSLPELPLPGMLEPLLSGVPVVPLPDEPVPEVSLPELLLPEDPEPEVSLPELPLPEVLLS